MAQNYKKPKEIRRKRGKYNVLEFVDKTGPRYFLNQSVSVQVKKYFRQKMTKPKELESKN